VNQEWTTRPERSNVFVIRFIVWFALTLGRRASRVLLFPICFYFIIFSVQARAASRNYLNRVLARRANLRDIFRHYFFFASTILDRVFLLKEQNTLFEVHVQGEEIFKEVISSGHGCFLIGAHMGSFEVLHALSREQGHAQTSMVMYEENARKLNTVLKNINPQRNPPVISLGKIDSMLKVREALEHGECIGMLADRAISGEKMISCEFLGGSVEFPAGPFRLAAILERPIILMFCLYQGGNRYNIYLERLVDLQHVPHSERDTAIEQAAQQFAGRLEHYCRTFPYNWFNFYDFWK
jgi:predicted LPLAT superfamily acyltransferase